MKAESRYVAEAERYGRQQVSYGVTEGPVGMLESELRRSLGMVRHLESLVAVMTDDQLAWGMNEADLRAAGVRVRDIPTILAQQHGKPHPLLELSHRERTHLTRLISISLNNGVPEKQRAMDAEQVDLVERAINAVVRALGHAPSAPEVRASVLAALRSL